MSLIERLKKMDADVDFKKKQTEYKKLKWQRAKKLMLFDLGDMPMAIFALIASVLFSVIVYALLFFEIIYPLTQDELYLVFSDPLIIFNFLVIIALIPILIFGVVIAVIGFGLNFYYEKKELEKEIKEIREHE